MAKKRPDVTGMTRQNLMDAYWDLYTTTQLSKLTVKMVTDRAGYNRGTFYAYFTDLKELQEQVENDLLPTQETLKRMRARSMEQGNEQLLELYMESEQPTYEKLSYLLGPDGSLEFQTKFKTAFRNLIEETKAEKGLCNHSESAYRTEMLVSVCFETLRYWFNGGSEHYGMQEIFQLMSRCIHHGLLPDHPAAESGKNSVPLCN